MIGCRTPTPRVGFVEPIADTPLAGSPFDPAIKPKYVLYPSDELLIIYPTDQTLDQQIPIRADGNISLPYVGDVQAADRSPSELAADINDKYQGVLKNPNVAVIVKKEVGRRVYFGGQVRTPGALTLKPEQTLTQCLFETGGVTENAQSEQIIVVRVRRGEGTYVLNANLDRILAGLEPDVRLEPYDIIHVPETKITAINRFVEQYINRMIPRPMSFPFTTELHTEPAKNYL